MRGILVGIWSFVALVLAPLCIYAPAQAQSTASVTVTVSVRPPEISLDIHTRGSQILPPVRFATIANTHRTAFIAPEKPAPQALATILGVIS